MTYKIIVSKEVDERVAKLTNERKTIPQISTITGLGEKKIVVIRKERGLAYAKNGSTSQEKKNLELMETDIQWRLNKKSTIKKAKTDLQNKNPPETRDWFTDY